MTILGVYCSYNMTNLASGIDYTFKVFGNGNSVYNWAHKNSLDWTTYNITKYMRLNNTASSLNYTNYYLYNASYLWTLEGSDSPGILNHEQGVDDGTEDVGYLHNVRTTTTFEFRTCGRYISWWIDDNVTINNTENISNVYWHVWYNYNTSITDAISIGYNKQTWSNFNNIQETFVNVTTTKLKTLNVSGTNYSLLSGFMNITDQRSFDNNDVYQFIFKMRDATFYYPQPAVINAKNASSFVILNLPSNATLQGMDSDGDTISDFDELYTNYTDPFFSDTDNDGVADNCDGDPLNPANTTNTCVAGMTVIYGPPSTTAFIVNQNSTGAMCGPDDISFWVEPTNQTSSLGIYNATNSGSITGNFQAKLSGAQNAGWILMLSNSSSTANVVNLTTSWQTIWYSVTAGQTKQIWSYTNCSNVNIGPGVEFQFQAA